MQTIKPPQSIAKHHRRKYTVFLAGSIEMGKAEDWQQNLTQYFVDLTDYTILNPRRDAWNETWGETFESPNFYQQVNWELTGLEQADFIILYLDPNTKAPISLLELGLHAKSGKIQVCCPEGYWRRGNVEIVCERYAIPFYNTLEDLLKHHYPK